MRLLEELEISNFRNIKNARFEGLKDVNLLIGPNNCGKTNTLQAIALFNKAETDGAIRRFRLEDSCNDIRELWNRDIRREIRTEKIMINGIKINLTKGDSYRENRVEIRYKFNKEKISTKVGDFDFSSENYLSHMKEVMDKYYEKRDMRRIWERHRSHLDEVKKEDQTTLKIVQEEGTEYSCIASHISFFGITDIMKNLRNAVVFCPDSRFELYKGESISNYFLKSKPRKDDEAELIKFIQQIVDSKVTDRRLDVEAKKVLFIRKLENLEFDNLVEEQGSGVRSLFCLAWDIIRAEEDSIILIDEPEAGINPSAKQEFLKFLLKQAEEKQIFIATHDPTFLNPVLWDSDKVATYLYSVAESKFVRLDLFQSREDPNIFAGYLPHTVSLKDGHIYVEGTSDVYIYQIFIGKYLQKTEKEWWQLYNRIGIYHLAGDFWSHLLYTIPKPPYRALVILDMDKEETARQVVSRFNENRLENLLKFEFCKNVPEMGQIYRRGNCPVYCLKKGEIEDYLAQKPQKKEFGPEIAEQMSEIDSEIEEVFDVFVALLKERT